MTIPAGTPVVVGDRTVPMPDTAPDDRVIAVHATGELLVVPAAEHAAAREAVAAAAGALPALADAPDEAITGFFQIFADRLADDSIWTDIAHANEADLAAARERGRPTTRLEATAKMRADMISGLREWAAARSRRGEVIETREGDGYRIERRIAPLGVVAFVFEGRPNVFADGSGVLRNGNAAVMRIGSDALGTAIAIQEQALEPALASSGLPRGAVSLLRSRSHAAAWALFTMPEVRLAVARGSGRAVSQLGAIAEQHGIPASLHGTGGAWMYLAEDADPSSAANAVRHSVDRKVCNTLNVLLVHRDASERLFDVALQALLERDPDVRLHAAPEARALVPPQLAERMVTVRREDGEVEEPQVETLPVDGFGTEWEWDRTPEVSIALVGSDEEAVDLVNRYSPRFVASVVTASRERFERFYARTEVPYVGNGFTRWVDGQWAWGRPELGLTNWERGRLLGRSGILAGDDVFTVRDVFVDTTGEAPQRR